MHPHRRALAVELELDSVGSQATSLFEQAHARWLERAEVELADRHLLAIAEAALRGLQLPEIEGTCGALLHALAKTYEWSPTPAQ